MHKGDLQAVRLHPRFIRVYAFRVCTREQKLGYCSVYSTYIPVIIA